MDFKMSALVLFTSILAILFLGNPSFRERFIKAVKNSDLNNCLIDNGKEKDVINVKES